VPRSPRSANLLTGISQNNRGALRRRQLAKTKDFNAAIAVVKSNVLPDGVLRTLRSSFSTRIVTYYTLSQIASEPRECLPRLIVVGTEIGNGTIENVIGSLSRLVPRIQTVVLAPEDDVDLARKVISLGAKAYIPVPTACEVVAVIRFILTSAA
jgi:DNA-binding NarL/FixJ family response regulator